MSSASPAAAPPPRARRHGRTRATLCAVACSVLLTTANSADAQTAPTQRNGWELLFSSGALIPTGAQRDVLKDAHLSTAQVSYVVRSRFAITTMFGWARSRDLASAGDPKLDVFTYDVGAEARAPRRMARGSMTFTPFVGAGLGSRSYNYRSLDVDATHNVAGYGAVGAELGRGRVRLRLEARDYVTGFKPLDGEGAADTRNDVVATAGLRFAAR